MSGFAEFEQCDAPGLASLAKRKQVTPWKLLEAKRPGFGRKPALAPL